MIPAGSAARSSARSVTRSGLPAAVELCSDVWQRPAATLPAGEGHSRD